MSCAKTNKDIFEIFSPSGSHCNLPSHSPYETGWRYSNGIAIDVDVDVDVVDLRAQADASMPASNNNVKLYNISNF